MGWQLARQGEQLSRSGQINGTDIIDPHEPLAKPLLHTPGCVAAASALLGSGASLVEQEGQEGKRRAHKWELSAWGLERESGNMGVPGEGTG